MAEPRDRPKVDNRKPVRIFGRVDDDTWKTLKAAAEARGKSFTQWALEVLGREAKKVK